MEGFQITPENAETAKIAVAGAFGAAVLIYLRHPGTLLRAAFMIIAGVGIASIFAPMVALGVDGLFGWRVGAVQIAAVLGMVGLVLARKLLDLVEKMDLAQFMPWRRAE